MVRVLVQAVNYRLGLGMPQGTRATFGRFNFRPFAGETGAYVDNLLRIAHGQLSAQIADRRDSRSYAFPDREAGGAGGNDEQERRYDSHGDDLF
ncbi:hypothetical protein [Novosphingobium sp. Leaf2]|uniref:hypothetical protein n=1 Tax=Novosphingobium sp. Leaf2 TaxID=1735670 RepID=UPI0012E0EF81|nr:hypothetical protein [Novosphingobium sp. Leaf2]